jgi:predicted GIY-YIG superfamily endonuclease
MNYLITSAKAAPLKSSAAGAPDESGLFPKHFVYVLRSLSNPSRTYTGRTEMPRHRILEHNQGACPHTRKFRPWRMETLIGFTNFAKALAFERYLKSGSGRAFAKSHLG